MRQPTWNEKMVIQMAGIPLEDATDTVIAVAARVLERCYYLDRAAEYLLDTLRAEPRAHSKTRALRLSGGETRQPDGRTD